MSFHANFFSNFFQPMFMHIFRLFKTHGNPVTGTKPQMCRLRTNASCNSNQLYFNREFQFEKNRPFLGSLNETSLRLLALKQ